MMVTAAVQEANLPNSHGRMDCAEMSLMSGLAQRLELNVRVRRVTSWGQHSGLEWSPHAQIGAARGNRTLLLPVENRAS